MERLDVKKALRSRSVIVFLIVLVCWMPYVIMTFPGNIAIDSGWGMMFFLNIRRTNPNNPYFQNVLMGIFYSIGKALGHCNLGIALYCFLQMLIEICLLTWAVRRIGRLSRIAEVCLILLYCVFPVFPMYAFTMVKDSDFALAVLAFEVLSLEAVRDEAFWDSKYKAWILALTVVLMALLRNYSGYVPAVVMILYAIVCVRKARVVLISVVTLLCVLFTAYVPALIHIPPVQTRERMSLPLQTTAYYCIKHADEITDEDKAIISGVIDYDEFIERYNPDIADPIKNRTDFTDETTGPFLDLWRRFLKKHPGTILEGIYKGTNIYYSPGSYTTLKPHVVVGYLSETMRKKLHISNENPLLGKAEAIVSWFLNAPVLNLFVTIGLYSIILLAITILSLVLKRPRYLLCHAILLMILIGCILSPVNGYYRYAYAMILSLPIVFADFACCIVERRALHEETRQVK